MQAVLKFALARDEHTSVVLDEPPSDFDAERWRRRLPSVGETICVASHRGRVRSVTPRPIESEQEGQSPAVEIEILFAPEDE